MLKNLKILIISCGLLFIKAKPLNPLYVNQFEQITQEELNSQITQVSQLRDINLNSWNFYALQNLNTNYQCLAKNPNLDNLPQTITRNHFAVLLHQCLNNIQNKTNILTQEDLATIKKLKNDFELKFISLKNQIIKLENKVDTLEKQAFSPQVKLEGEVIIALADVWQKDNDSSLTLGNRVRFNFLTSFSEKDQLQIRLQGRNIPEFESVTGTNMSNLGFDGADDNEVEIDEIEYEILLTENTILNLYGVGGGMGDLIPAINSEFSGSGDGAISLFGRENPIRRQAEGAAIAISQDLGEKFNLSGGYVSNDASDPESGLFTNPYGAIAQIIFLPNETLNLSFTYNHTSNNVGTGTGSELAENPFADSKDITSHGLGGEFSWLIQPNISLGGRIGWIQASANDLPNNPQADILTWAMMLGIKDLGTEDSLLGLVFGQPPKTINNDLGDEFEDPDTAYHLELFYRWQLTDDLAITPGFFTIFNPEHDRDNDGIVVGTVRTTLEF